MAENAPVFDANGIIKTYGYYRLAELMGEYATFRRFGQVQSLNLLYLQAELVMLEIELK